MTRNRKQPRTSKSSRRLPEWKVLRDGERVRWAKVQTAQARIASGFYERDEVQSAVISAVLRELRDH